MDKLLANPKALPKPYWANTSSNSIIRELVEGSDAVTRAEMELLINGETIEKPIHEEITYGDIYTSMDNLWNFLFFTGYLKNCGENMNYTDEAQMKMAIPNREIKSIYKNVIMEWFDKKIKQTDRSHLYSAVTQGDAEAMENILSDMLQQSISFYDYAESFYHGFLTGILADIEGYLTVSNRESGIGRPDLILKTGRVRKGRAIILELKVSDTVQHMEACCDRALQQIEQQHYEQSLLDEGYEQILKYGICFFKKECMVKTAGSIRSPLPVR